MTSSSISPVPGALDEIAGTEPAAGLASASSSFFLPKPKRRNPVGGTGSTRCEAEASDSVDSSLVIGTGGCTSTTSSKSVSVSKNGVWAEDVSSNSGESSSTASSSTWPASNSGADPWGSGSNSSVSSDRKSTRLNSSHLGI